MNGKTCLLSFLLLSFFHLGLLKASFAQEDPDPTRFREQVEQLNQKYSDISSDEDIIVFTGSSSIRGWERLENTFPDHTILNTGFGGSQASDLLYYLEDLILQYAPRKVFIYEGDNDINSGKSGEGIMETLNIIVTEIHERHPGCEVILISAKPSISRWHLKEEYEHLNALMEQFSRETEQVWFANVWDIMLNDEGEPREDIFLDDDLHMNQRGYDLWEEVIRPFLE